MKQDEVEEFEKLWRKAMSPSRDPDKEHVIRTNIKKSKEYKAQSQMLNIANEFVGRKMNLDKSEDNVEI